MNLEDLIEELKEHKRIYGGALLVKLATGTDEKKRYHASVSIIERLENGQITVVIG